jgi:hypothetical protein
MLPDAAFLGDMDIFYQSITSGNELYFIEMISTREFRGNLE